jgi:hypothetical protein
MGRLTNLIYDFNLHCYLLINLFLLIVFIYTHDPFELCMTFQNNFFKLFKTF